jgi:hypothetical protein
MRARCERMGDRCDHHQAVRCERQERIVGAIGVARQRQQREVDLARIQALHQRLAAIQILVQHQAREHVAQRVQAGTEPALGLARVDPDRDPPFAPGAERAQRLERVVEPEQGRAREFLERCAVHRRPQPARGALEQLDAEQALQLLQ